MTRAGCAGVVVLCVGLAACGGRDDAEQSAEQNQVNGDSFEVAGSAPIIQTGCLTARGDRFVLTTLETGGLTATELYQLVGNADELRPHVGRQVRVTGDAAPGQVAELRDSSVAAPAATSGSNAGTPPADAQVRTETQTRLETRQLRVTTVTPTGDTCATEPDPR